MEYTVSIAVDAQRPLTMKRLEAIAAIGGHAAGKVGKKRVETTLTIEAKDMPDAAALAATQVQDLVAGDVASVEVMTLEEHDRRLAEKPRKLAGLTEVGKLLKVSRQRAAQLAVRQDAPAPIAELAAGPVWYLDDWSTFKKGWHRQGGRPRKSA